MQPKENQRTISDWAHDTFGKCSTYAAFLRMDKEYKELSDVMDQFLTWTPEQRAKALDQVANECADILITLYRVADVSSFDLHEAVDHKMKINRARKWKVNSDGTGQHE